MDNNFRDQFLQTLEDEKRTRTRGTPVRVATKVVSHALTYTDSVCQCLYRHQYKAGKPHITYSQIRSSLNPLARVYLQVILVELEKDYVVERLEVRGKLVYRLSQDFVDKINTQIEKIHEQHSASIVEGVKEDLK